MDVTGYLFRRTLGEDPITKKMVDVDLPSLGSTFAIPRELAEQLNKMGIYWVIRQWNPRHHLGYRFPNKVVACLNDEQVATLRLAKGDLVTVRTSNGDENMPYVVTGVHGMPVAQWLNRGEVLDSDWGLLDNKLRSFVRPRQPTTQITKATQLLFPLIQGSSTLVYGPPGSQKTLVLHMLQSSHEHVAHRIVTERSSEAEDVANCVPWYIPVDVGDALDQLGMLEYTFTAIERAALAGHHITVVMDSVSAAARVMNLVYAQAGNRPSTTLAGGLLPETVQALSRIFSLARHPTPVIGVEVGSITLVASQMLVRGDTQSENLVRILTGIAGSHVHLVPKEDRKKVAWLPFDFSGTLHRRIESIVHESVAGHFWDMHISAPGWGEDHWKKVNSALESMSREEVWIHFEEILAGTRFVAQAEPEKIFQTTAMPVRDKSIAQEDTEVARLIQLMLAEADQSPESK